MVSWHNHPLLYKREATRKLSHVVDRKGYFLSKHYLQALATHFAKGYSSRMEWWILAYPSNLCHSTAFHLLHQQLQSDICTEDCCYQKVT